MTLSARTRPRRFFPKRHKRMETSVDEKSLRAALRVPWPLSHTRRTALLANHPLGSAEITHPFHPRRGQRFVVLKVRTLRSLGQRRSGLHPSLRCSSTAPADPSAAWLARDRRSTCPLPPFGPSAARRRLLCPRLTSTPRSDRLATTSVPRDTAQTSRGKTDRLRRTPAGSTTPTLDGRGLRDHWLARPAG